MGVKAGILFLIFAAVAVAPAGAGELFRKGPVTCRSVSPDVTAMTVSRCDWTKAPGGGFYTGRCDGSVAIGGEDIRFTVSGQAKRVDYVYPDNGTRLTFDYPGLTCSVDSPRVKTVQNCRATASGKECQVCAVTAAKVCFNVRLDLKVVTKSKSKKVVAATAN